MPFIAGVDGCKAGWLAIFRHLDVNTLGSRVVQRIDDLFEGLSDLRVVTVDIPIGLTNSGARRCDVLARMHLGPRASSIFPAPIRAALSGIDYQDASRISREHQNRGISKQSFAIYSKIKAVDDFLCSHPDLSQRVYEVHPEICFHAWNRGQPMEHPKKSMLGARDRLRLVESHFGSGTFEAVREQHKRRTVADDDILDAFAALWTAERVFDANQVAYPSSPHSTAAVSRCAWCIDV